MKKQLYIYAALIVLFLVYNFLLRASDERTDAAVNILLTSIIFGYIAYMATVLLKRLKK